MFVLLFHAKMRGLYEQFLLLGKVDRATGDARIRKDVFMEASLRPCVGSGVRRIPRQDLPTELVKIATDSCGGLARASGVEQSWKTDLQQNLKDIM